jgi:hypothetical protein
MPAGYFPGQERNTAVRVFQKGFKGFNPVFYQKGISAGYLVDIPDKPLNFIVKLDQDTVPAGTALQIGETKKKGKAAQDKAGGGKDHGNDHGFNLPADVHVFAQGGIPDYRRRLAVFGTGGIFFVLPPVRSVSPSLPAGVPVFNPIRPVAGILKFGYGMKPFFGLFLELGVLEDGLKMNPFFLIHLLLTDLIYLGK